MQNKPQARNRPWRIWRENTTIKMASIENQSLTEELLEAFKEKTYDTCVSNLTKTHRVNLNKFKRQRLPEGTWINTKRFVNNSNRPVADAMFSLFGEFSNQVGTEVRDTMIGWSYDNFRLLERVFKVALDQRKTTLREWLEKMADEHTPGDEPALYVLARMYRRHVYVYTQMFWWTTLLYSLPVTEQELLSQCEVVLVYVKDGVYGELDRIRSPAKKGSQSAIAQVQSGKVGSLETGDASYEPTPAKASVLTIPDTIGSTFTETMNDRTEIVTTESAGPPQVAPDDPTVTSHSRAAKNPNLVRVITENVELYQVTPSKTSTVEDTSRPRTSLPGIGVFLDKTCTIPLVRCDFDTIKTTVESREEIAELVNSQNKQYSNNPTPSADSVLPTTRTSARKRMVINYKDFLEEFADLPPSPPKRKREVDLKRRPSKSRMAAEKYRKSDFATKPLNVPKPVRRKVSTPKSTPGTSTNISKNVSSKQETITKPATTQETEDAIEALLLLGTMGMPSPQSENDGADNEILMPIGVNLTTDNNIGTDADAAPPIIPTQPPKVDTGMDAAIEKDTGGEPSDVPDQEPQEKDAENKQNDPKLPIEEDDENKGNKKKTFVTRQFGLKRRNRPKRKFKCEKCAQELETVRDYNQHYLDKHPPTPCPDCLRQFTSPRTMAKHRYSHAETMYECETCGQGFTFRSQYLSHRKVHLTIQGFVCFKAKCGQRFKRESELNAHLKAHDSTPIKCEHCDYTNKDQRNLRAHMRIHSEKLPFFCVLCGKRFRWQEQKCRHIPNCTGD